MSQSRTASLAIADRYAHAAFALAVEAKKESTLTEEMGQLADAIQSSAELKSALANPLVGREAKAAILADLAKKADTLTRQTLKTLAEGGRADIIPALARALAGRLSESRGEIVAEITSARALSPAMQKKFADSLAEATGKAVRLELKEDPSLIGGVAIQLGSLRLDASLQGALNHMRADLLAQTA
jgi:F-type H+-transporting ATPase subunit delta